MNNEIQPFILISNDDGVDAPGLKALVEAVAEMGEIVVVAPATAQSGKASAITVDSPLRLIPHAPICGAKTFAVTGTPVDCIKLGLYAAVDRRPDLVLSGINHGSNSGNSVIYSGTMGAVMEACMVGIPAIGFSLLHHSWAADFSKCAEPIRTITANVINNGLPQDLCLNVNIPARCTPKGIRVAEASRGYWTEEYVKYTDPHGKDFYWLTGRYVDEDPDNSLTDNYWLDREYVSVVPVRPDQTDRKCMASLADRFNAD
ncbi:MAG: 5'/3'-nucleotidase SurE [Bacteroides sp.]|nr:5'/3'-nucleotidase SurE [Bacteroides sp.]MCM1414103.1 5'/3'-nucleotidase SurE [Bacteroides sp.]MCM1472367.1 5'/3'-nucleotidase SurE [Bacteroides sp.]